MVDQFFAIVKYHSTKKHCSSDYPFTLFERIRHLDRATMSIAAVGVLSNYSLSTWLIAFIVDEHVLRAVTEIAERVGYSSASTFGIAFRRHTGMSPSEYAVSAGSV